MPELCGVTRSRPENSPANLAPPLLQHCVERNKVRARSTPKRPASLRQTTWFGNVLRCVGSARRKSSREISAQGGTALQLHRVLTGSFAVDPCFERVVARRKSAQPKSAAFIGNNEVGRFKDENEPGHVLVNIASKRDQPRDIKNYRRNWPFFWTIAAEI